MKNPFGRHFKMMRCLLLFALIFSSREVFSQQVIDQVLAVVGSKIVLRSDVEKQYVQYLAQGSPSSDETKCQIFDQILLQKLMLNQAELDSVNVSEVQVDGELDRRMRFYVKQIGSEQKLEEYFHTTIRQLKSEMRDLIRDQLLVQTIQGKITKDITATPNDVREYFESIPADSLPYMDAEMEIAQIMRKPQVSEQEKLAVRERLEEFRKKILAGEDFAVFAALYSQDQASAKKGGELGFFERGAMVPEFEAMAFSLKAGEVSPVFESKFGMHIMQLIERRGDEINVRHILIQPKSDDASLAKCYNFLDSLGKEIAAASLTFEEAAEKFSDDEETRNNGGLLINQETSTTKLSPDKIDRVLFFHVDTLPLNKVSTPIQMTTTDNKQAYRIVLVKSRSLPHKANLREDYQKIQEVAVQEKQNKTLSNWVEKKRKNTYVHINGEYGNCEALRHWNASQ